MYFHGLYFDTRISNVSCGRCGKAIQGGLESATIYRGGSYGQGKGFHILCAILTYEDNIKECKRKLAFSGKRYQTKISI